MQKRVTWTKFQTTKSSPKVWHHFGGLFHTTAWVGRYLKDLVPTPQHRQGFLPSPSSKASDSECPRGIDWAHLDRCLGFYKIISVWNKPFLLTSILNRFPGTINTVANEEVSLYSCSQNFCFPQKDSPTPGARGCHLLSCFIRQYSV